jgi:O-antigen ligase
MCLPIALHFAFQDKHRPLLRRWFPVAAIAIAVPISISRSAIVSTVVVLCFLIPSWPVGIRRRAYGAMFALSGVIYLLVPGLLGTLAGLFTGISSDTSAQSRTGSYPLALQFIERAPVFGRGFQTFLTSFWILDDQYLGTLIETGIVGLAALLGLFITGVTVARRVRKRSADARDRSLAQSLAAAVASALVSFALFDAFSFPMAASLIFFILGCVGALNRLVPRAPSAMGRSHLANLNLADGAGRADQATGATAGSITTSDG